jgi:hypothetical protein
MRVHVTLKTPHTEADIATVVREGGLVDVNMPRARKYGVVSGKLTDAARVVRLRSLPCVEAVEADGKKGATVGL